MKATGDKGQGFPLEAAQLEATLLVSGRRIVHEFQPVETADWLQYERLATSTSRRDGDHVFTESMKPEAVDWLWKAKIKDVVLDGAAVERTCVPLPHREAAIDALAKVSAEPDPDFGSWLAVEPVILVTALRNGRLYKGLRHIFRQPTSSEHADYSRARGRAVAIAVGGDRRVVACSSLADQLELYDKLILRVEGYEPNDPKKMDAMHKKVAVQALMEIALGNVESPAMEPAETAEAAG